MTTLYDCLGVPQGASEMQIRDAWRKARRQWHPDYNRGNEVEAAKRFQDLKSAYEILCDRKARARYDATFAQEAQPTTSADPQAVDPNDARSPRHAHSADAARGQAAASNADGVFQTYRKQFEDAQDLARKGDSLSQAMQILMKHHHCPAALARRLALKALALHQGGDYVAQSQACEDAASAKFNAKTPTVSDAFTADGVYETYRNQFEVAQDLARRREPLSQVMLVLMRGHNCPPAPARRLALRALAIHRGGKYVQQSNNCEYAASVTFNAKADAMPQNDRMGTPRQAPQQPRTLSGWRLIFVMLMSLLSGMLSSR